MYLADYHIHSRISPDARTSMADLAEAAVKAGLDEVIRMMVKGDRL